MNNKMSREINPTNLIILAGGEGKRVGKEKAFLEVGGRKLLDRILDQLKLIQRQDEKIIIVTQGTGRFRSYKNVEIREDIIPGRGPLEGIYSGLLFSQTKYNLILACDMPFLSAELLDFMLRIERDYQVLIPRPSDQMEPLVAIYSRETLPIIEELLGQGNRRVSNLFSYLRVRYLSEPEIVRFGRPERLFFNVNTLSDLSRANELAKLERR